ncbi:MAG TPA: glycerol kinase GlpK [Urbifossiella sp.]|nr:glycerol kinase GlpK [Urbifossiella sp.]
MKRSLLLAIDQGTTSSRALVYDSATFAALGSAQREIEQHYPKDGWVEHDAEEIWSSTASTIRDALASAGASGSAIAAIGLTNQRETVVLWERSTGRPVHRAIVWQDRRTAGFCRDRTADQPWLAERTGLVLDPYFSGTKLHWLLASDPSLAVRAAAGHLACGTVDSFLIWRLTGGSHLTDASNASRTLLFNIHSMQWDDELLAYFKVPRHLLPEVRPSAADFGTTRGLDFLPDGIPIRGVAGDQQAALFGQCCFDPGEGKCTYGTGAFFLLHTGDRAVSSRHRLLTTVAATVDAKPRYALEGAVFVAGAAVQWLRDGLHLFRSADEVEALARASNPAEPVLFVPGFVGLGAPQWVPEARGAIFGLTRATTAADLARAALEGVALQVADLIEAAANDLAGSEHASAESALRVDGGMARNDWFLQCQADLLGRPVSRAGQSESTALGAAMLAAVGEGLADEAKLRGLRAAGTRFEPQLPASERAKKLAAWRKAVQAVIGYCQ